MTTLNYSIFDDDKEITFPVLGDDNFDLKYLATGRFKTEYSLHKLTLQAKRIGIYESYLRMIS